MFFEVLQEKGLGYVYRKSDNLIILWGDTPVLFRSMEKEQHLRGPNVGWIWIDEAGQMPTRAAFDILHARCRHMEAKERCILLTTTPDGLNWLYDLLDEWQIKDRCKIYSGTTRDNTSLPDDYFELLDESYDEKFAKQELLGQFLNVFSGQAYWAFDRNKHLFPKKKSPYQKGHPLILACDFNVSPMCWNIMQEIQGFTYVIDEIHIDTTGTEVAAREFKNRYASHKGGLHIFGDASGYYSHTSSTETDYVIMQRILKGFPDLQMNSGRSNPEVKSRVASMNGRLLNLKDQARLFVSDHCTHTIRCFEQTTFKPGTQELDKSSGTGAAKKKELTHHTDAIGYFVEQKHPLSKIKGRYAHH
jgi:hypothetical protein